MLKKEIFQGIALATALALTPSRGLHEAGASPTPPKTTIEGIVIDESVGFSCVQGDIAYEVRCQDLQEEDDTTIIFESPNILHVESVPNRYKVSAPTLGYVILKDKNRNGTIDISKITPTPGRGIPTAVFEYFGTPDLMIVVDKNDQPIEKEVWLDNDIEMLTMNNFLPSPDSAGMGNS